MFFLILGHFATLFLSTNYSTTLEVSEPIEQVIYGGSKGELFTYLSLNKKTLTLKPLTESLNSNLTLISKNKNYNFWIKMDNSKPHVYVKIINSSINSIFRTVFENDQIKIQEGDSSTLIFNKTKDSIEVNGTKIVNQEYFSKGIPFIINDKRIFN